MKFWDSSALLPLAIDETSSEKLAAMFRNDPQVIAWWATPVECASAIARREREGGLTRASAIEATRRLTRLQNGWREIQPIEPIRDLATRLLRVHALRAADSLQLAAAIIASENKPPSLEFVCLDQRLSEAAEREGFALIGA
jgi:uncharacterized protein